MGVSDFPKSSVAAAYSTGKKMQQPVIKRNQDGSCRVTHKEFVTNVSGSDEFNNSIALSLNPGLQDSFPWLSTFANSFQLYEVHSLAFKYYTRTGSNSTGSVIMSPDYDSSSSPPVDEATQAQFKDTTEDAPWKDQTCRLTRSAMHPSGKKKFTRFTAVPSASDIKLYDVGKFYLSSVDGSTDKWGKLWVEYDIEFSVPQKPQDNPVVLAFVSARYMGEDGSGTPDNPVGNGTFTYTAPIGYIPEEPFNVIHSDQTTFQFEIEEDWLFTLAIGADGGWTGTFPNVLSTLGGVYTPIGNYVMAGSGTTFSILMYGLYRSQVGSRLAFGAMSATTVTDADLRICAYSDDLGDAERKKLRSESDKLLLKFKSEVPQKKKRIVMLEPRRADPAVLKVGKVFPKPSTSDNKSDLTARPVEGVPPQRFIGTNSPTHYWCPPP